MGYDEETDTNKKPQIFQQIRVKLSGLYEGDMTHILLDYGISHSSPRI
jgi:hypothetical protein